MDDGGNAPFEIEVTRLHEERARALAMGGEEKLRKRASDNLLNARERLARLFDPDSFREVGMLARSHRPEDRERTPADGKIVGFGRIEGRKAAVVSNDMTVMGASSSQVNMKKIQHVRLAAIRNGMPIVFLGESSGARMPDNMGAEGMGTLLGQDPTQYLRIRTTPWASALLGPCYGSSALYACQSDFVVMRKGAVVALSSPKVTALAINQEIDPEELGGWQMQTQVTGLADQAVDTDEEAIDAVKRFLSYLPSNNRAVPPAAPVPPGSDEPSQRLLEILPASRSRVYDVRKVIDAIVDRGSFFPLKERFARSVVTGLARISGRTVGVLACNPMVKAGALDADGCDKASNLLVLCDSFNVPIVVLADTPGFLIGIENERRRAPGKVMNYMQALQMCTVPKVTIIMRKSYGQAYLNMGGGRNSDNVAAWFTAEVSFMDPSTATSVVHGVRPNDDPVRHAELRRSIERANSAYDLAAAFAAQDVIDPRDTRSYLVDMLSIHERAADGGIGQHMMAGWPTTL